MDEALGGVRRADDEDERPVIVDGSWQGAGPFVGSDEAPSSFEEPTLEERVKFGKIMQDVLGSETPEELPSKLTPHVQFLLGVDVPRLTNELIRLVVLVGDPTCSRP